MKKVVAFCLLMLFCINLQAQKSEEVTRYETIIYTDDNLSMFIQNEETRGFAGDLLSGIGNLAKSGTGGIISGFVDMGINAITSLLTKGEEDKKIWEDIVTTENSYIEELSTEQSISDFYTQTSSKSPMDPQGMKFDGIGCLRKVGNDTVLYISCRVNRDKLSRIINHSKFELTLDTLIINPYKCNLPNSTYDTEFSYDRRKDFRISMDITLLSSWMNIQTMMQKDQELGSFSLKIPVSEKDLNEKGELRYVRTAGQPEKYQIEGESFIVPRSYMGYRDSNGRYQDSWGTGEYKVNIALRENCNITDSYRNNWKADFNARKEAAQQGTVKENLWKVVKTQVWDGEGKKWVISATKLPADMLMEEVNKMLGIDNKAKSGSGNSTAKPAATGKKI